MATENKDTEAVGGAQSESLPVSDKVAEPQWAGMRRFWYSQTYILLEIAKLLNSKEMCFIEKDAPKSRPPKVMRCGQGYTIDLIKSHFNAFRFLEFPGYNMYYSLMNFSMMPVFSFSPPVRKQEYQTWTDGDFKRFFKSYDWGIDFDSKSIPDAQQSCLKVKALLDQYKIPMSCKFSGAKGFHIRVRAEWLPPLPLEKIVPMLSELTHKIKVIDGITDIDDSIIDDRRVFKCDYSFDRGKICLPLSDEQIEHFTLDMVEPAWVLKNIMLKNRGVLERFTDQSPEQAQQNFLRLAENFIDVKKYMGGKNAKQQREVRRVQPKA